MILRTAVVGLGVISGLHIDAVNANDRATLVAVCDIDPDAVAAATTDDVHGYTSIDEMLAEESPNWVHLCTPIQHHYEQAKLCLNEGANVLIEKPATETVAEYDELRDIAAANDVVVDVVHSDRWFPAVRRLQSFVDSGRIGDVRAVEVLYSHQSRADEPQRGDWVLGLPGGEFEEGLSHPFYMALQFAGAPDPETLTVTRSRSTELGHGVEYDGVSVAYRSERDVHCSVIAVSGGLPYRLIRVTGTTAIVEADLVAGTLRLVDTDFTSSPLHRIFASLALAGAGIRGAITTANRYVRLFRQYRSGRQVTESPDPHYAFINDAVFALLTEAGPCVPADEVRWTLRLIERVQNAK